MRRVRRSTQRNWITAAIFVGIIALWALIQATGILEREDKFLPQTLAYAQEPAPAVQVKDTPTRVDSGVKFDLSDIVWEGNTAFVMLSDGRKARLSLDRELQTSIEKSLTEHPVPHGGAVAIEPQTGRILAIVSASHDRPAVEDYAVKALAPSASVFKLITAAALLEKGSVDPQARVCYSGGQSMLSESDVRGNPQTDNTCATLEQAIGHSINAVMARLAYQHLGKEDLERIALRFAFNRELPTEFTTDISEAEFVDDDIERAKTAAGFWHVNLSPMHGALIAAAIQNHGIMMTPTIIDEITNSAGTVVYTAKPRPWLVTMSAENADTLARLGQNTTREGTARRQFSGRKGWRKGVTVGGKTGTLSNKRPFYTYNWFVGWGEDKQGQIAVGALVVNTEKWWIKGSHVASRVMGAYFKG
ncbi:MAG: penicillin-binding protein [Proteobacteria bacterium]|nr:penicillin-binding protein [Pseudomonadota bacterium]